jgi:hypothetical protein
METLLGRQNCRTRDLEPVETIFAILKNLPNGPNRIPCYSDRAWRWSICHGSYGPTSRDESEECFGRDKFLHNWIGNTYGDGNYVACKRAGLDSGAPHVSVDNLIRE